MLLLDDLESIKKYFNKTENLSYPTSNIRYSAEWQSMVVKCTFLRKSQVRYIYKIYDLVYDYNYEYENGRKAKFSEEKSGITFPIAHKLLPTYFSKDPAIDSLFKTLEKNCKKRKED